MADGSSAGPLCPLAGIVTVTYRLVVNVSSPSLVMVEVMKLPEVMVTMMILVVETTPVSTRSATRVRVIVTVNVTS